MRISTITNYTRAHPVGFTLSIIGIFTIGLFAYISFNTIMYAGKVRVEISTAPSDAIVMINGKTTSAKVHYLEPKKYTFSASKDGFETHTETIYLTEDQTEADVALSLIALTDDAKSEADKNMEQYLRNEGIAGKQKSADGLRFREKNPIVEKLPYKTLLYTIGYRSDKTDPSGMSIIIEVDTTEGRRADVVAQIERWGYDPTKLNIQFRNYENPFDEN
jgi:hypothetical protein